MNMTVNPSKNEVNELRLIVNYLIVAVGALYHDTSVCGLLVPVGIIHPVISVSALTQFIRYIC